MKRIILTIVFVFFMWNGYSQTTDRVTDTQENAWYMYFGTFKVNPKLSVHGEIQLRRSGLIKDPQQLLLRTGLNYHLNKNVIATVGYGFIDTHPYGKQPVAKRFIEHRLWQQLILNHSESRFLFNHRYRQEQRWLETPLAVDNDFNYVNRSRYRLMVNIPLNNRTLEKGTLFLSIYDEIFLNFGKNVNRNIFDQNRIYAAIGFQIGESSNIQLGYLNQKIQKGDGVHFENNKTFQVAFSHTVNLAN